MLEDKLQSEGDPGGLDCHTGGKGVKEAHKLGEDTVAHAVVYDAEAFHANHSAIWSSYRQHYLTGDAWIELYFRVEIGRYPCKYVAVISAASGDSLDSRSEVSSVDTDVDQRGSKDPVLVNSVKLVQQGERISGRLVPIASFVRLFRIHDSPDIVPDALCDMQKLGVDERIIGDQTNRETGTPFRFVSVSVGQGGREFGKSVDDVIQGGADLITELPDSNAEIKEWWKDRDKAAFIERLIRIELTEHACWVERVVLNEVLVDGFQVLMCPLELKNRPFKGMRFTPALKFHVTKSSYAGSVG